MHEFLGATEAMPPGMFRLHPSGHVTFRLDLGTGAYAHTRELDVTVSVPTKTEPPVLQSASRALSEGKTFIVRWDDMIRGAGTSKVGRAYLNREGFELFVPGETLLAVEFDVTIVPRKSKWERKLDIARTYLAHATSSPEHAEEMLTALAGVDREKP